MYQLQNKYYTLLVRIFELACKREPVQGNFSFSSFNFSKDFFDFANPKNTKEGVANCGTIGCLAGGYLPLISTDYHFDKNGVFRYKDKQFKDSPLYQNNEFLVRALFYPACQSDFDDIYFDKKLGLRTLYYDSTKSDVLESMKTILDNLTTIADTEIPLRSQKKFD